MGIDVAATAKEFEKHAQTGYLPEYLAREMHNMSPADRLAVAKQVEWDIKHQSNTSLPKVEFYDSGDLKSVETSEKTASGEFTKHSELDKNTGTVKAELNVSKLNFSYEQSTNIEYVEKDSDGHTTYKYDTTTTSRASGATVSYDEDRWTYDAKTGKQTSHDEKTSWGKKLHEEFDGKTGHQKLADETNPKSNAHRTYDVSTGKLKQEEIDNDDKTHETNKYNSNGDLVSKEKRYGDNGDKGTRTWIY